MTYTISIYKKVNNVWTWVALTGVVRPFSYTEAEDETLDSGTIQLVGSTYADPIRPMTYCKIEFGETGRFDCVISNTKRVKRTFSGTTLYDWQIEVVELTKVLERQICDSMTFTNYLGHNYTGNVIEPTASTDEPTDPPRYYYTKSASEVHSSPMSLNSTTTFGKPSSVFTFAESTTLMTYSWNLKYKTPSSSGYTSVGDVAYQATFSQTGVYEFVYELMYCTISLPRTYWTETYTYSISVVSSIAQKTDWTIKTVCERILSAGKTRRVSNSISTSDIDRQLITLDSTFATAYQNVKAPEFYLTRCTFFDALSQVGGAIHAIPRLYNADEEGLSLKLTFDKLGGSDTYTFPEGVELNYEEVGYNVEDYASEIDSTVENIVNTTDPLKGSMVEPCLGGYTTIRTERGSVEISADTMKIQTSLPIYRVNKLEVSVVSNGTLKTGDITPYVYENAEYQALSQYASAAFPYSKAYALVYTQGQKDISELNFKATDLTGLATAFQNYAIKNIVKEALGVTLSDTATSTDYVQLAFRVTYTAIPTARITQKKAYTGWEKNNTIIYNQDGNTVEAFNYGEKLKGAIARLGNQYYVRTYTFDASTIDTDKPKLGQLTTIDGQRMYITLINATYDYLKVKMTIWFTPNFNRLSEYVGINSNYRLYDVSEKQSIERLCNYGEVCYITSRNDTVRNAVDACKPFLTYGNNIPMYTINQNKNLQTSPAHPTMAEVYLYDSSGDFSQITRPLTKLAIGNSVALTFQMDDNYGVGYQSIKPNSDTGKRVQKLVPYGDVYGEFKRMHINLYENYYSGRPWAVADQQGNGDANMQPVFSDRYEGTSYTSPDLVASTMTATNSQAFLIDKDSREKINFTFQLHYVSIESNIVVGSAMAQNSCLIGTDFDSAKAGVLYYLKTPINILQDKIDLTSANATRVSTGYEHMWLNNNNNHSILRVRREDADTSQTYKAWAIVEVTERDGNNNPTAGKLYIGRNNPTWTAYTNNTYYYNEVQFNFADNSYTYGG